MDLERRLAYYLPRLEATMAAAESAVAELERAREGFAPARWFGAYLAAQDALALHVTGEVRGAATLENFKYRDARLVEARYYSDAKTYSGEAEDDANEALRRLAKVLDEQPSKQLRRTVERLGLARERRHQELKATTIPDWAALFGVHAALQLEGWKLRLQFAPKTYGRNRGRS